MNYCFNLQYSPPILTPKITDWPIYSVKNQAGARGSTYLVLEALIIYFRLFDDNFFLYII